MAAPRRGNRPATHPVATVPNLISLLRLSAVPVFLWLFTHEREEAAVAVFGAGALTDFLDGYIARRTASTTELGKLIDPLADRLFIVALVGALVVRGAVPGWLALTLIGRDALLLGAWIVLERRRSERIPVSLTGKAATALLLAGLSCVALGETHLTSAAAARRVGIPTVVTGTFLYWAAAVGYARLALARGRRGREDVGT